MTAPPDHPDARDRAQRWRTTGVYGDVTLPQAILATSIAQPDLPVVFQNYLPTSLAPLPTVLFGVGAILIVRNPDGALALHGRQLHALQRRLRPVGVTTPEPGSDGQLAAVPAASPVRSEPQLAEVQPAARAKSQR